MPSLVRGVDNYIITINSIEYICVISIDVGFVSLISCVSVTPALFFEQLLVKTAAWIFPSFSFLWLAEETKKNLPLELDFEFEGKNAERVSDLLQGIPFLKVSVGDVYNSRLNFNINLMRIDCLTK